MVMILMAETVGAMEAGTRQDVPIEFARALVIEKKARYTSPDINRVIGARAPVEKAAVDLSGVETRESRAGNTPPLAPDECDGLAPMDVDMVRKWKRDHE